MKREALLVCLEAAQQLHSKPWARSSIELAYEVCWLTNALNVHQKMYQTSPLQCQQLIVVPLIPDLIDMLHPITIDTTTNGSCKVLSLQYLSIAVTRLSA